MAKKTKQEIAVEPVFQDNSTKLIVRQIVADLIRLSNAAMALADANENDQTHRQYEQRTYMQIWGHRVYLSLQKLNAYAPNDIGDEFVDETMEYNSDGSRLIEDLHNDFMRYAVKE